MAQKLQPLRGTKDLLPEDFRVHEYIINSAKKIGELYGYQPMSTPIIEYTNVFDRTLGSTSDAVSKEMYSFLDKSNESIALRPEFTAGIIRAYISNGLTHNLPLRFFSYGPLFRYDRPQLGRQRQLHQINFEYIGAQGAYSDAETIKLAQDILDALEINHDVTLELNSLGSIESRSIYQQKLLEYFTDYKNDLSEDSLKRLDKNPLRILDSKDENDKKLAQNAPLLSDYYMDNDKNYFEEVLKFLDVLNIKYVINPRLVRGLDYYCHTAFEFTTTKLGAQSSIVGGGRYDGLSKIMGGPETPAIGFAAGIERLYLMREYILEAKKPVIIMPIGEEYVGESLKLAGQLRHNQIPILIESKGKLDKRLSKALKEGVRFVIFIGEEESRQGRYKLKDLSIHQESNLSLEEMISLISNNQ